VDRAADREVELGWRLRPRLLRTDDLSVGGDGARFQRLEGDIGCHQLGQGCREPWGIGILGVQDGAFVGLEGKGGSGGSDRRSHQDRSDEEAKAHASSIIPVPSLNRRLRSFKNASLQNPPRCYTMEGQSLVIKNVVFWGISL
jgi:hypothetical protein